MGKRTILLLRWLHAFDTSVLSYHHRAITSNVCANCLLCDVLLFTVPINFCIVLFCMKVLKIISVTVTKGDNIKLHNNKYAQHISENACTYWRTEDVMELLYRIFQGESTIVQENVPCRKLYWYNQEHLYPKLNSYTDNGERSFQEWKLLYIYWLRNAY